MNKRKFALSIILVLVFVVALLPVTAYAEGETTTYLVGAFDDKENATILPKTDDIYYAGQKVETVMYTASKDATRFEYAKFALKDTIPETITSWTPVADKTFDIKTKGGEGQYVFRDVFEKSGEETKYSTTNAKLVIDITAPVLHADKFSDYLKTNDFLKSSTIKAGSSSTTKVDFVFSKNAPLYLMVGEEGQEKVDKLKLIEDNFIVVDKLKVTIQYIDPTSDYSPDSWEDQDMGSSSGVLLDTIGTWWFRYKIVDLSGNESFSEAFKRVVIDNNGPVISFSSSTKTSANTGISAGAKYTIPSPTLTDNTNASNGFSYLVYKKVAGEYVLIFDSTKPEKDAEYKGEKGYEKIVVSGVILTDIKEQPNDFLYKIVYSSKDKYGFVTETAEDDRTINLRVNTPDVKDVEDPYRVWKIVLIVIACVAAAGIIVVLFVKPKEEVVEPTVDTNATIKKK